MNKSIKRLIIILLCLLTFLLAGAIALSVDKKVSNVDIVSNDGLVYVSKQSIIDEILELSQKDWLNLSVDNLKEEVFSKPGVDYVLAKKIWPSTLVLYMYDRRPVGYWGDSSILLENMDIIEPEVFNYDSFLPHFHTQENNNSKYVYDTYKELDKVASKHNSKVLDVFYEGNQFSVDTEQGLVALGSKDLSKRFELFFDVYNGVSNNEGVEYFDMRYNKGFVVKYK